MKVLTVNHSDVVGGAARAAYRIHLALRRAGVDSTMLVADKFSGDWTVEGPRSRWEKAANALRVRAGTLPSRLLKPHYPTLHSCALLRSRILRRINESDADLVHLHWVCGELLSIEDIGRIRKPCVWTLHDMWAFCGAEHYSDEQRWRDGYVASSRSTREAGWDLNRWVWNRKRRSWRQPIQVVTPSNWLAHCVRDSALMRQWPVTVVANGLDTDSWKPIDRGTARSLLGLPTEGKLIAFGAMGGGADPRKGIDLLQTAIARLRGRISGLSLVVFGEMRPPKLVDLGFPMYYTGHLHDDLSLRALYSAADVFVIPSRQDNLPNTAVESLSCGTPVLAFETGGLPDIVEHQKNGWLAAPYDVESLAEGVVWMLSDSERHRGLSEASRRRALDRFSYPAVAEAYREVYRAVLTRKPRARRQEPVGTGV